MDCEWICSTDSYYRAYCLLTCSILVDIQHILSSSDPVEIDSLAIGFRLDDFLFQFHVSNNTLKIAGLS